MRMEDENTQYEYRFEDENFCKSLNMVDIGGKNKNITKNEEEYK